MNYKSTLVPISPDLKTIVIDADIFTIGRGLDNSFTIEDNQISRTHCEFNFIENKWTIIVKGSNGVEINDIHLSKDNNQVLKSGDVIKLSDTTIYKFDTKTETYPNNVKRPRLDDDDEIMKTLLENKCDMNTLLKIKINIMEDKLKKNYFLSDRIARNEQERREILTNFGKLINKYKDVQSQLAEKEMENMALRQEIESFNFDNNKKILDLANDELTCTICRELYIKARVLNCAHTFCDVCISKWRQQKNSCPMCKTDITHVSPCITLDNFIDEMINALAPDKIVMREDLKKAYFAEMNFNGTNEDAVVVE